ncbi:LysR family transcriptional regulator [Oceanobacillus jeddahense]|uniref:LysR family transcriptional regulator n=1 Tax=Oceanobacillus jeddahense TaxID=1462527 RepID=A0ABY5JRL9_9BACI|nr:LysR family transcriptional regulator [Oceanobacillus jeddahense]UUI02440.1 LysR family transcriptional regulator [Oceanobacillus jeddahense]
MNVKDWELLIMLQKEGSITKTAQKLYISQPALTYRIKQLEKEFQTTIILRGSKGIIFTTEGEHLINYAKTMMMEFRKVKDNIINMNDEIKGTLRIGVSSTFARYQLPDLMEGFLKKHPKVEIHLLTGWSSEVMNLLYREEIHLAIVRGEQGWRWPYDQLLLEEETLYAASKHKMEITDLPALNQIDYQTEADLSHTFNQWWQEHFKIPPKKTMRVDRLETAKELVKKGLGYGLFPGICLTPEENLHTIPLTSNGEKLFRKTILLYKKDLTHLKVACSFIDYIKDVYDLN